MALTCREKIVSEEYADWIIDFELTEELKRMDDSGIDYCYEKIDEELGIIYAKRNQMEEVGLLNYSYQQIPSLLAFPTLATETVMEDFDFGPLIDSGIIQVQDEPLQLTGEGVIIAMIGTGIDYRNPLFKHPDGSTRILAIWDQTGDEDTTSDEVPFGRVYTKEMINEALKNEDPFLLVPVRDESGVSTAMAAVAAGSNIQNPAVFTGAAPNAELVIVKLKEAKSYLKQYYLLPQEVSAYQSTDIMLAVRYADSFTVEFFRPVIFCLGMGTNYGGHSGTTPLSRYLERIGQKRSRTMIISGGEEGNRSHHYYGQFKENEEKISDSSVREIEIRVGEKEKGFLMEIWGRIPDRYQVSVKSPGGEEIPYFGIRSNKGREYSFIFERTRITATYALVTSGTQDQLISLRFEEPTPGIWTVSLKKEGTRTDSSFHAWLPLESFLSGETYFLTPSPDVTITVPSFTPNAICVASYSGDSDSIYVESGRGFSRGIQIKPDVAAPAVKISVPLKSLPQELRIGKQTGSPLSTALTVGATAQFLQWAYTERRGNYLNSNEVKSLLILGAVRNDQMTYPNRQWGYGKLNVEGIFTALAER